MSNAEENQVTLNTPYFWSETERLIAATYRGFLAASPIADSFSGWSLGFAGVGYSLLLSQFSDLPTNLKAAVLGALWWFVAAGTFAVVAKIAAISVSSSAGGSEAVVREVNVLREGGLAKVNWDEADEAIGKPLWWPLSRLVAGLKRKGVDNLHGLRLAVRIMQVQAWAVTFQLLALLGAAISFAWRASCFAS